MATKLNTLNGPGTGALAGPPIQHNYKRAIVRPPPRHFTVEVLPPTKFGTGYCYGLRVCPYQVGEGLDDHSSKSSKSTASGSLAEYEVWRRWEDCLWFQELIESEYTFMARAKRTRLAAGKGVRKADIYQRSDHASSFESLPPGPDAKSVAKDIHDIVPKLTKKGTFFRANQATIEQRAREFRAMITGLLADDVPTLVKELCESRIVRDFFAVWRRDKDHERKMSNARPSSSGGTPRHSVAGSTFSMYFSASNISLQLPPASLSDIPPSPSLPSHAQSRRESTGRSPPSGYTSSESPGSSSGHSFTPQTPVSAPAIPFSMSDRGSLSLQIPEDVGSPGPLTAPSCIQSTRWSHMSNNPFPLHEESDEPKDVPLMYVPGDDTWPDAATMNYVSGLQALPEEQELVPDMMDLDLGMSEGVRPPVRRSRISSFSDRTNRNCLVFTTPPESDAAAVVPESLDSVIESLQVQPTSYEASLAPSEQPAAPTTTMSSRPSSMALSMFSSENISSRSSWRTSVASDMSATTGFSSNFPRESCIDIDRALAPSVMSMYSSTSIYAPTPTPYSHAQPYLRAQRSSISTMNSLISNSSVDAVLPRRMTPSPPPGDVPRRSLSAGSVRPSKDFPAESMWYEQQDDLLDAYFYDPGLRDSPVIPPADLADKQGRELLRTPPTPDRFPKPFQNRPPGQFHLPWSSPSTPPLSAHTAPSRVVSPVNLLAGVDMFTLKAMLHESIVLLRVPAAISLAEVRTRLHDKFAGQEQVPFPDAFTLAYHPPPPPGEREREREARVGRGRARSSSVSTASTDHSQPMRCIASETDWQTAVATCPGKLTVRVIETRFYS